MLNTIFNNQQRSGYEELFSYGPRFYKDIKEMDAIYRLAGATLDIGAKKLEVLMNDQFIEHADEETISRYEKWLHIEGNESKSLEDRRKKVKLVWNGGEKLSGKLIKSLVKSYTGCDEEPSVRMTTYLKVIARVKEDNQVYLSDLYEQLYKMLPAHIRMEFSLAITSQMVFQTKVSHYLYHFTKAGENPKIATHGAYLNGEINAETDVSDYVFGYKKASETVEAGTVPDVTTFGVYDNSEMQICTTEKATSVSFSECGSKLCGEEGL